MATTNKKVMGLLFFQCSWWASLSAAKDILPYLFVVPLILLLTAGQLVVSSITNKFRFSLFIISLACLGFLFDLLFSSFFILTIKGKYLFETPFWLFLRWLSFAGSYWVLPNGKWESFKISFFLGALGGPLSYWVGEEFAVLYIEKGIRLLIYVFYWGMLYWMTQWIFSSLIRRECNES